MVSHTKRTVSLFFCLHGIPLIQGSFRSCSDLTESSGSEKTKLLLKYVISHTAIWTVGPLDYCGVAKIICAQGSGQDM